MHQVGALNENLSFPDAPFTRPSTAMRLLVHNIIMKLGRVSQNQTVTSLGGAQTDELRSCMQPSALTSIISAVASPTLTTAGRNAPLPSKHSMITLTIT